MSNIDSLLDPAGVEGAVVLDDIVSSQIKFSSDASGISGCCVENTIVADADVFDETG